MAGKTWFITGASRGFGREWATAALDRGDQVVATARHVASLDDLAASYGDAILPLGLDVTDRDADFAAVKLAHDYFGRLDVTVYNAGRGQFGLVEEISEAEIRAQLETNLLGALWVTQAALPYLREQGSGHIVQVSGIGGISAFPNTGAYHASQWALEGLTQSLAAEVAGFGVKVTLIVPMEPVDPGATRAEALKLVDSPNPPLRLFLGEALPRAGFAGVVAASRNPASSASRGSAWRLAAMAAVRLASNG
jgi:NAD(P)-dependent dehydrogenase (short-subunit alcohol dehydrogenase family)